MPSVGPHINLSQAAKRKREAQDEGDKGDQMVSGPSSSSSSLSNSASVSSFSPTKKPRTIGPTLPPASLEERPLQPPDSDTDSSSSDEEIGPGLPADNPQKLEMPTGSSSAVSAGSSALAHGKSERDEWMIVPPSSDDWTSRVDPTKLKNRKFNTGKGSKGQGQTICKGSNASWTETPDERRARLQREMMGTKEISTAKDPPQDTSEIRENAKKLREYNVSVIPPGFLPMQV